MVFEVVGTLAEVGVGESIKAEIGGVPLAVARIDGDSVRAVHNVCSHQQYELAPEGWVEDNRIECALHGSMFDMDTGHPDALPAVKPIPVYAAKVENGMIYVDVEQQLNDAPVPEHSDLGG